MRTRPNRKELLSGGGHLAAVWALAFVQPLLDLLGKNPDFFIARGNGPGDILIFAVGFTLLPPLLFLAVEAMVVRVSVRAYRGLHLLLLGGISTVLFVQIISRLFESPTGLILLLAVGLGTLFVWAVRRVVFFRNLLDILTVAPLVILALFLFASPAARVILPGESEAVARTGSGGKGPVVLMIFDELGTSDLMSKQRKIDRRRFPNFARFADHSTWFINQSTIDFFTPRAVPAILTGRRAPDDALPTARDQPENIFTLLGADRPVHAMEPVTSLCPVELCPASGREPARSERLKALVSDLKYVEGRLVLPPKLAERLPDVSSTFQDFGLQGRSRTSERTDRFFLKKLGTGPDPGSYRSFIREIPKGRSPLVVMHLVLPHQPWQLTTDGRLYNRSPINTLWNPEDDQWQVDADGIATAQARMYTQTGFADRLLGRLERTLKNRGIWNQATVVVAADHGTSFEGDGVARRRVDRRAMGEVANPPLLIKYPGQRRGVIDPRHSTTLDILPTISRAVGAKDDFGFDGFPLQGPVPQRPVSVKDVLNDDREVSVDVPEMIAQRNAALRRSRERLGTGPLYTLGPAGRLIGRKVPPLPAGSDQAELDSPDLWQDVHLGTEPVPIHVTGRLGAIHGPGTMVAIAVNGTIGGTGRSFEFKDQNRFGVLIDPDSLVEGRNEIGIYAIEGRRLTPLGGT